MFATVGVKALCGATIAEVQTELNQLATRDHDQPGLIFLGSVRPELRAATLLDELRRTPQLASLPAVQIVSGVELSEAGQSPTEVFVDRLKRPIRFEKLLRIVKEQLGSTKDNGRRRKRRRRQSSDLHAVPAGTRASTTAPVARGRQSRQSATGDDHAATDWLSSGCCLERSRGAEHGELLPL
jgi:DNA-binding NtrC family response regulator